MGGDPVAAITTQSAPVMVCRDRAASDRETIRLSYSKLMG
jgi:hypothetical protein